MQKIFVDAHCDTISAICQRGGNLVENNLHLDIAKLRSLGSTVQFFALFADKEKVKTNQLTQILKIYDKLIQEVENNKQYIEIAYNYEDIIRINKNGRIAGIISLEGGEALCGEISTLRVLHKLGVICMNLTWNYKNEIACGVLADTDTGISRFGYDVISEMNDLKMIIDVSHLGELGFWKTVNQAKTPIIASHSNVKRLCNHIRNLSDEQIIAIAKTNGTIGICYNPDFLNEKGSASISDVIRHIEYICGLAGTNYVGLGSDFDGINRTPKGLEDASKVGDILNELARLNYSENQINAIVGGNMLRVIKDVIN